MRSEDRSLARHMQSAQLHLLEPERVPSECRVILTARSRQHSLKTLSTDAVSNILNPRQQRCKLGVAAPSH